MQQLQPVTVFRVGKHLDVQLERVDRLRAPIVPKKFFHAAGNFADRTHSTRTGGDHAPYALPGPGNLEAALRDAGLQATSSGEVTCRWHYASMDDAIRALLCSAGRARAAEAAGPQAVHEALRPALGPFQDPRTGRHQPAQHVPLDSRPPLSPTRWSAPAPD